VRRKRQNGAVTTASGSRLGRHAEKRTIVDEMRAARYTSSLGLDPV
jgi:hypothetical protein